MKADYLCFFMTGVDLQQSAFLKELSLKAWRMRIEVPGHLIPNFGSVIRESRNGNEVR